MDVILKRYRNMAVAVSEYVTEDAKDAYNLDADCTTLYITESKSESYTIHGFAYIIKESNSFNCRLYKNCERVSAEL